MLPYRPYGFSKDFFRFSVIFLLFIILVFFFPWSVHVPERFTPANRLVTPAHIFPHWSLSPFYAILRAVPDKLGGVLAMFFSYLLLFFLPIWAPTTIKNTIRVKLITVLFFTNFFALGYFGFFPADGIYLIGSRLCTMVYFSYFAYLWFLFRRQVFADLKNQFTKLLGTKTAVVLLLFSLLVSSELYDYMLPYLIFYASLIMAAGRWIRKRGGVLPPKFSSNCFTGKLYLCSLLFTFIVAWVSFEYSVQWVLVVPFILIWLFFYCDKTYQIMEREGFQDALWCFWSAMLTYLLFFVGGSHALTEIDYEKLIVHSILLLLPLLTPMLIPMRAKQKEKTAVSWVGGLSSFIGAFGAILSVLILLFVTFGDDSGEFSFSIFPNIGIWAGDPSIGFAFTGIFFSVLMVLIVFIGYQWSQALRAQSAQEKEFYSQRVKAFFRIPLYVLVVFLLIDLCFPYEVLVTSRQQIVDACRLYPGLLEGMLAILLVIVSRLCLVISAASNDERVVLRFLDRSPIYLRQWLCWTFLLLVTNGIANQYLYTIYAHPSLYTINFLMVPYALTDATWLIFLVILMLVLPLVLLSGVRWCWQTLFDKKKQSVFTYKRRIPLWMLLWFAISLVAVNTHLGTFSHAGAVVSIDAIHTWVSAVFVLLGINLWAGFEWIQQWYLHEKADPKRSLFERLPVLSLIWFGVSLICILLNNLFSLNIFRVFEQLIQWFLMRPILGCIIWAYVVTVFVLILLSLIQQIRSRLCR